MKTPTTLPQFNHPEIENLYRYGLELPSDVIEAILQLPRATVIADLEAVLKDVIDCNDVFEDVKEDLKTYRPPFHAMLLLGGLRSEESLPLLLKMHQQDSKWIDYWISSWFLEVMWEPLMWCGMNRFNELTAFIINKDVADEFATGNAMEAMVQAALHFPEKRAEIIEKLKELFDFYLSKTYTDASRLEMEFSVTNLVNAVNDLKADPLLPFVEQCYNMDLVDLGMFGDWNDFMSFYNDYEISKHDIFPNVADWYVHELEAQKERDAWELKRNESK